MKENNNATVKFNEDGKVVYRKGYNGTETWYEYDENGKVNIHMKDLDGFEAWFKDGKAIHTKYQDGHETWNDYDQDGNFIHEKDSYGLEMWYENEHVTRIKYPDGREKCFK